MLSIKQQIQKVLFRPNIYKYIWKLHILWQIDVLLNILFVDENVLLIVHQKGIKASSFHPGIGHSKFSTVCASGFIKKQASDLQHLKKERKRLL